MSNTDAITRDTMLALFNWRTEGRSTQHKANKARQLSKEHKLFQYPDPARKGAILYSRAQCERIWKELKPLQHAA